MGQSLQSQKGRNVLNLHHARDAAFVQGKTSRSPSMPCRCVYDICRYRSLPYRTPNRNELRKGWQMRLLAHASGAWRRQPSGQPQYQQSGFLNNISPRLQTIHAINSATGCHWQPKSRISPSYTCHRTLDCPKRWLSRSTR